MDIFKNHLIVLRQGYRIEDFPVNVQQTTIVGTLTLYILETLKVNIKIKLDQQWFTMSIVKYHCTDAPCMLYMSELEGKL